MAYVPQHHTGWTAEERQLSNRPLLGRSTNLNFKSILVQNTGQYLNLIRNLSLQSPTLVTDVNISE